MVYRDKTIRSNDVALVFQLYAEDGYSKMKITTEFTVVTLNWDDIAPHLKKEMDEDAFFRVLDDCDIRIKSGSLRIYNIAKDRRIAKIPLKGL